MDNVGLIEFTLSGDGGRAPVEVRLRRAGERWVAQLPGTGGAVGMGTSARAALKAALEPLGSESAVRLLADVGLMAPSRRVIEFERRAGA